jgi:hypothetical protein
MLRFALLSGTWQTFLAFGHSSRIRPARVNRDNARPTTRGKEDGPTVRYIIINGYYYPGILQATDNNSVAHFPRSISVRLRSRAKHSRDVRSRLRYRAAIPRSIIDKARVEGPQQSAIPVRNRSWGWQGDERKGAEGEIADSKSQSSSSSALFTRAGAGVARRPARFSADKRHFVPRRETRGRSSAFPADPVIDILVDDVSVRPRGRTSWQEERRRRTETSILKTRE